ncbi:Acyl-CoA thioester hydrolase, YbgC/YbaW family [Desulfonema limicola]|uniref:Acyl-CoA thioester hydrolase, YbgC/YbaW family n=1 Tax=Desulfonema limicola TaxID=45656 RepID=A0A975BB13_9BACT|nr:YbgC/FadM family acyl-CoA thioesterase [Desulfonema limicola]QTA82038.1 Acyl-CoA thioester hydrolase, YbgC/YbaW family [Desulfonema limicola]
MSRIYHFPVQIYYEDTDHSGVVYHANYLKYFERAREHVIGTGTLVKLLNEQGLGFAVYKAELGYFEGAEFGDELDIRTRIKRDGAYKVIWFHEAWLPVRDKPAVTGKIELVCLDRNKQLKPIPDLDF